MRVEDIGLHIPCFTPKGRSLVTMGMPGVTNTSQFSGMSRRVAASVLSLFLLLVISLFPSWPNWRKEVRCWRLLLVLNSVGSGFIILKGVKWLVVLSVLCLFLPQRLQRAAPGDDLVEHCMDRLLVLGSRLEDAEVFKVGKHGEQDLVAHRGDLHLGHHQA